MKKKSFKNNPYIFSYLTLALLCCIGLSILFLYINIETMKKAEKENIQKKLELISQDMNTQLDTFKHIQVKIQINPLYKPTNYSYNKYNEILLLKDFSQYRYYSPLNCEYFLYYKNAASLFSSNQTSIALTVWLDNFSLEERNEILLFINEPTATDLLPLSSADSFLLRYPLKETPKADSTDSVFLVMLSNSALLERFQMISGGLSGEFALLKESLPILSTTSDFDYTDKDLLSATTKDNNNFTVCFIPDTTNGFSHSIMLPQLSLISAVIIFILFISLLFASHSYKPILQLSEKYRKILPADNVGFFSNELENLNYMMDSVIRHNITANNILEQKQLQLQNQLLLLLISGKLTFDVQPYLLQLGMPFPGPWYFVIVLSPQADHPDGSVLLDDIKKAIGHISKPEEEKYIYYVTEPEELLLNCLCSISERIQKEEIIDEMSCIIENFDDAVKIGCGNEYTNIRNLSASYLDACDKLHEAQKTDIPSANENTVWDDSLLSQIHTALIHEQEELAQKALERYVQHIRHETPSPLMQQYLFSKFLNELNGTYKENQLEMPKQWVSLILSAKDISQFSQAAEEVVKDFSTQLNIQKEKLLGNASGQVLQYMQTHFADYDMSIEKVVQYTNTNPAFVRNVIKHNCKMGYIDYLIHLRIEYAKKLLLQEGLTVAETCQKIGYAKVSYFIKIFKAHTGVTPAAYKKTGVEDIPPK